MAEQLPLWWLPWATQIPTSVSGQPAFITWKALDDQFGQGDARLRDFRRRFLQTLCQVKAVYPSAQVEADEGGLTLF